MRPSEQSLVRGVLRDLAVDIRCARRDGLPDYAEKCAAEFRDIWPRRATARTNRYGWPKASTERTRGET